MFLLVWQTPHLTDVIEWWHHVIIKHHIKLKHDWLKNKTAKYYETHWSGKDFCFYGMLQTSSYGMKCPFLQNIRTNKDHVYILCTFKSTWFIHMFLPGVITVTQRWGFQIPFGVYVSVYRFAYFLISWGINRKIRGVDYKTVPCMSTKFSNPLLLVNVMNDQCVN